MAVAVEDYVVPDNPTNNFATLNPLENSHPSSTTVGKGNLYISSSTDLATLNIILATIGMPLNSGKFYFIIHMGSRFNTPNSIKFSIFKL